MNAEQSPKRLVLMIVGLILAIGLLVWQLQGTSGISLPYYDFVEYWSAGRLCSEGQNPYSHELIEKLERDLGREEPAVLMWNPPWTLTLVMPFGLLPPRVAHLLWLAISLAILLLSAELLWRLYSTNHSHRWLTVLGLAFVPSLIALTAGQISPWLLLGATLFLFAVSREQWMLAGMASVLLAIKPHLSYLFWLALLLWCIQERQWKLIFGGLLLGGLCSLIPIWNDPDVFTSYLDALRNRPPAEYDSPTLGTLLRLWFDRDNFSLQYLSMIPGLLWLIPYWLRHRRSWDWKARMPMLLLVSMLTAAYGAWPFDAVLLLVAVLAVACRLPDSSFKIQMSAGVMYLLINVALALLIATDQRYFSFIWLTPALLLCYLLLTHATEKPAHA